MKPSEAAIRLIKQFEVNYSGRVALEAYDDGYGNWTIGWGRVQGVQRGDTISLAQAETYLQEDLGIAARAVEAAIDVSKLAQHEYDALVVMSFNCRSAFKRSSSLVKAVNAGERAGIDGVWLQYAWAVNLETRKRTLSKGLARRRRAELRLWHGEHLPDNEQAVAVKPGSVTNYKPAALVSALFSSWTIRGMGGVVAGKVVETYAVVVDTGLAAVAEVERLAPIKGLFPNAKALAVGLTVWGVVVVIGRRLDAARVGKTA